MKKKVIYALNVLIVAFTLLGLGVMVSNHGDGGLLSSSGWENLKYFTVLSNLFCGIVATVFLARGIAGGKGKKEPGPKGEKEPGPKGEKEPGPKGEKEPGPKGEKEPGPKGEKEPGPKGEKEPGLGMMRAKLMAATAVAVTFLMIAGFFGPIYGWLPLYQGSNLEFHLIVPVFAMIEICLLEGPLPFSSAVMAGVPALVYGCVYLGNILINGKGEWPDTNDWYGFMNWGFGIAMVIFGMVVAVSFAVACLLRFINSKVCKR